MKLPFEALRLREEVVRLDYGASRGFGQAYLREAEAEPVISRRFELLITAASSFRQAGADAMLLGDGSGMRDSFRDASGIYERLGSPYAVLMASLADEKEIRSPRSQQIPLDKRSPKYFGLRDQEPETIYLFLINRATGDATEPLVNQLRPGKLGTLDLPVSDYLELVFAVGQNSQARLVESLTPFVTAYDDAIRLASSRRVPWQLLVQRMHPAEPDIIGLLVMVQLALRNDHLVRALRAIQMSEMCKILLFGCLNTRFENTDFQKLF